MFKIVGLSFPTNIPQVSISDLPVSILSYTQSLVLMFLTKKSLAFDILFSSPSLSSYTSSGLENEFAITYVLPSLNAKSMMVMFLSIKSISSVPFRSSVFPESSYR